jgi:acyl-CoA thioesterase-1
MKFNSLAGKYLVMFVLKWALAPAFAIAFILSPSFGAEISGEKSAGKDDKITIVVLGDSLVAGYGLAPGEAFPERLAIALGSKGYKVTIINAGVSGDTTAGGLARLDWSVGEGTSAVIVELGANDALRGIDPAQTAKNLEAIITGLKKRGIAVLLAGMRAPPNMGQNYVDKLDAIYSRLAKKFDLAFYPFFLEGVAAEPELNQHDGIHPTAEGILKITSSFLPSAINLIESLQTIQQ